MRKLLKSLLVSILLIGVSILITLISEYKWENNLPILIVFNVFLFCAPQAILFTYYYFGVKDEMTDTGYVLCFLLSLFGSPILFIFYVYMCLRKSNTLK